MSEKTVVVNKSSGWLGLLGIIFVMCKILEIGVIATWSWWLVLLPFYLVIAVLFAVMCGGAALAGLLLGVAWVADEVARRKRRKAYLAREAERQANLKDKLNK